MKSLIFSCEYMRIRAVEIQFSIQCTYHTTLHQYWLPKMVITGMVKDRIFFSLIHVRVLRCRNVYTFVLSDGVRGEGK